MSLEHTDCYREAAELQERIEALESDNEYLKYHYNDLLENYAKVCSGEELGDYKHIKEVWLKLIEGK